MVQTTQGAVRRAFDARLATFSAGGAAIITGGVPYQPQAGVPYITGRVAAFVRAPLGVGASTAHRIDGTYQVNVNRPATEGADMADSIAGRIARHFTRGTAIALETGPVLTLISASEQPEIRAGDWITVPILVVFYGTD